VIEHDRARVVYVLGEAGIGKSALVERFVDRLAAASPAPLAHVGRCLA